MSTTTAPIRLFIGSSAEGLQVAHNLQAVLEERRICEVDMWDAGVFEPSGYTLDSLLAVAARCDFAVLVASPDDVTSSRGNTGPSIRDNIVLEFGLFTGALGRDRTYLLSTGDAKLPTDTLGLTRLPYRARSDDNIRAAVNDAALRIAGQVTSLGARTGRARTAAPLADDVALAQELSILCTNARSQGWIVKTNNPTTLRLVPPDRRPAYTMSKRDARGTREDLRAFAASLRAAGLRVNHAVRSPINESPY